MLKKCTIEHCSTYQPIMKFTLYLRNTCKPFCSRAIDATKRDGFSSKLDETFPKAYKPSLVEKDVYASWEERCFFTSKNVNKTKYSLVLPPPNVTGTLHLGHAITAAIQDTLVRWERMQGKDVVWVPGLDHAGIATQTVVERWLQANKNVSRLAIGKQQFLEEVHNWKREKGNVINKQLRGFGVSLDWSREIFTMDPRHNEAVVEAVVRLWNAGLVYRKKSLINWSCQLASTISDIEVDMVEVTGPTPLTVPGYENPVTFGELTEFAYKVCNSEDEVVVATTRPETMLGDVAVAVHPDDERYSRFHRATLWHPFRHTPIPLICDSMVDMSLGTGAVKITPAHSSVDWEVAQRHSLPSVSVINERGNIEITLAVNKFQGMKRFDARKAIKEELGMMELLRATREHTMKVPVCSRSGDIVESILRDQWFVSCKGMAEKACTAVREGHLQIQPKNYETIWFDWLENIRDWCISRQLWWGHQMPLYLARKASSSLWVAARTEAEAMQQATQMLGTQPDSLSQDPDVMDTWFSSAVYPLSAFGWPHQTKDWERYYPLDMMETGHDILFFWVARMVMLGTELTDQLPFKKVSLHGMVCDAYGRKMSKSLGNVINPEDVINGISLEKLKQQVVESHKAGLLSAKELDLAIQGQQKLFPKGIPECGTDALRFTLLSHNSKNHFINFDVSECEVNHHFCNKIWQATRFSLRWAELLCVDKCVPSAETDLSIMDRWILSQLQRTVEQVNSATQSSHLCDATAALKNFLYYQFCDVYVETTKPVLREGSDLEAQRVCQILLHCLEVSLRLLSPIMPFISEQLYRHLPQHQTDSAMLASFPVFCQEWRDPAVDSVVEQGFEIISAIRSLKSTHGFYKKIIPVEVETTKEEVVTAMKNVIELLATCSLTLASKTGDRNLRDLTLTESLNNHTYIHISLKDMSNNCLEDYLKSLTLKEEKIQKKINKLRELKEKKNYERKTRLEVQQRHTQEMLQMEEELNLLRICMKKINNSR